VSEQFLYRVQVALGRVEHVGADSGLRWSRIWFEPVPPGTHVGGVVYGDNCKPI